MRERQGPNFESDPKPEANRIETGGEKSNVEIEALIGLFLSKVKGVLGERFVGMYVFGSLASGDFNLDTSDIDWVVVTDTDLSQDVIAQLGVLNDDLISSSPEWGQRLEGSFLPQHVFQDFNPDHKMYPSISVGGNFDLDSKGIEEAVQRYMVREDGIVLAGPSPKTFIDPVKPEDLRKATLEILHGWWKPQLDDPFRLKDREYQAYAVLTMCRMLYTLTQGAIASKPASATWAMNSVDQKWRPLIERAVIWKPDDGIDDLDQTLEFIGYVVSEGATY